MSLTHSNMLTYASKLTIVANGYIAFSVWQHLNNGTVFFNMRDKVEDKYKSKNGLINIILLVLIWFDTAILPSRKDTKNKYAKWFDYGGLRILSLCIHAFLTIGYMILYSNNKKKSDENNKKDES